MDAPLEQLRALYEEWARGDFTRDAFDSETVSRMIGWVDLDAEIRADRNGDT
jgi:hypothetical protein